MSGERKRYSAEQKAKVAIEALKGLKTTNELAKEYGLHPVRISQWKSQLVQSAKELFGKRKERNAGQEEAERSGLYEEIGRLQMELVWQKKDGSWTLRRSGH